MKKRDKPLILDGAKLVPATKKHKFEQWWYGVTEPYLLKYGNLMLSNPILREIYIHQKAPASLPVSIVLSTNAACNFIDFIYSANGANGSARMSITKCVCQTTLKTYCEPVLKDMSLLYTADMYTTMKHKGIKEDFFLLDTAEEAKEKVRFFDKCGLIHAVFYCHGSGKWAFVMCNCYDKVCIPYRSYMAGRKEEMQAGPERVKLDASLCYGVSKCGKCIDRCKFKANSVGINGKSCVDITKCLGCGLCTTTCPSGARILEARPDYNHEDILTTQILLGRIK